MYLRHHGSRSRQSYHGGSGNQPLWDLLLNESQNQRYDYCVHHYPRNNPMRKTQILCWISDQVTFRELKRPQRQRQQKRHLKIEFGLQTLAPLFYLSSVEEFFWSWILKDCKFRKKRENCGLVSTPAIQREHYYEIPRCSRATLTKAWCTCKFVVLFFAVLVAVAVA